MPRLRNNRYGARALLCGALCLGLSACGAASSPAAPPTSEPAASRPALGVMTSLPLYWPLGADIAAIAAGSAPVPWQRGVLEQAFRVTPLDTLSPMPGLAPDAPEIDPLAGLDRLAVIQPRGLSPSDNVALDDWVRAGGRLLLVLDPQLTGEYDLPLGDPRRPAQSALIPPVAARWGLAIAFDEAQAPEPQAQSIGTATVPLVLAGQIAVTDPGAAQCTLLAAGAAARCKVGAGQVTVIADAAIFEHAELAGEGGAALAAMMKAVLG